MASISQTWICEQNILRFERQLDARRDGHDRPLLLRLLGEERTKLRLLANPGGQAAQEQRQPGQAASSGALPDHDLQTDV